MPQLQQWEFFLPFSLFWTVKSGALLPALHLCASSSVHMYLYQKTAKQHWFVPEGIGNLSWKILFPLFPFFLAPSPSSLQEVTLNRELFSRLQLEFYNKISVRSPYFFTCKVVAVIIWQLPSWLTCSRLNWGSPELKVWAATLWAKAL